MGKIWTLIFNERETSRDYKHELLRYFENNFKLNKKIVAIIIFFEHEYDHADSLISAYQSKANLPRR